MTYSYSYNHYSSTSTYEVTAFSEASAGVEIGVCTTFTLPATDTCITIKDDDKFLSGDACRDERADDSSYQTATIQKNGVEAGNGGKVYAEQYYWVKDGAGNWYVMVEIEQEGTNDDYFTFYTGSGYTVPPAGVELTVVSTCNVTSSWLDYRLLDAGECAPATGSISGTVFCDTDCDGINGTITTVPGDVYTIEAEKMWDCGFSTFYSSTASGGKAVKLSCAGGYGELAASFGAASGTYDIKIRVQDENDGQSVIKVLVGGHYVDAVRLDGDNNGSGNDNGGFSTYVVKDVQIHKGETVKLKVYGDDGEYVRIDKIDFQGEDKEVVTSEPVKQGVTVKLLALDGTVVAETVTGADGTYTFDAVPVGDYRVMGVAPDGTEFTIQDVDGNSRDDVDSDVDASGLSGVVSVQAGKTADIDMGVCDKPEPGSLSGRYFCDTNDDDIDGGQSVDPGIAGVRVELLDAAGNGTGITTMTGPDGTYVFAGLDAGTYGVRFTDPNGVLAGKQLVNPNVGADDTVDSDAIGDTTQSEITGITVVSGAEAKDNDAGAEYLLGSLGDTVWFDTDKDGVQDAGEAGVAGVTVTLTGAGDDGVLGTSDDTTTVQVTDGNGTYLFDGLKAGDYKVTFSDLPAGYTFTTPNVGDDALDSDAGADGMTGTITLAAGETNLSVDAGIVDPGTASVAGRYFCDENDNDVDDAEPGVSGVTVALYTAAGVFVADTVTAGDGSYEFTGLDAGDYVVTFSADPDGKVFVAPNVGPDDTVDSDGVVNGDGTASTGVITLAIGERSEDNDVGVEYANLPPEATPDAGEGCADELITVDLSDNYSDPDSASVAITMLAGQAIADGATILVDGTALLDDGITSITFTGLEVTRAGDSFVFDGEAAFAALDIGESASTTVTFKVEDSDGAFATSTIDLTFCGDANTLDSLCESLPDGPVTYQIRSSNVELPIEPYGYDIKIVSAGGDARFEDTVFAKAYCLSAFDAADASEEFATANLLTADMFCASEATADLFNPDQISNFNGNAAIDNMDLVNWILNQDFESQGFSGWEVQLAIWELTDDVDADVFTGFNPGYGDSADVDFILAQAAANGEGYVPVAGDVVGVILDPNPETAENNQPFILAMNYEDIDCLC